MAKFLDKCWDAADWVMSLIDYEFEFDEDEELSLDDIAKLSNNYEMLELCNENGDNIIGNYGIYPLSETEFLVTEETHKDDVFVLVKFYNPKGGEFGYGGYEYRWCEIDSEEEV